MQNDFRKNGNKRTGLPPRFPVFHVPHCGWKFPQELTDSVCVPEEVFLRYHEKMQDRDIFRAVPEACRGGDMYVRFQVSRLLCDVERFIGPGEVMEQYGMGYCYEKACDGTVIKHVTDELRKRTLRYYREHHERMDHICERHRRILLIDLHSYSDEIIPPACLHEARNTPDLCIGTDGRYTRPELAESVQRRFSEAGFSTAVNYPYSGFFVPDNVMAGRCECDLTGIMLEFHKRAYCNEAGKTMPEKLAAIREAIRQVIEDCADLS